MTIGDTSGARARKTAEVLDRPPGGGAAQETESPWDRLDLSYSILGKVAGRLSKDGASAMEGLLRGGPAARERDLNRLIIAIGAEDPEETRRRKKKDPFDALDEVMDVGSGGMGNLLSAMQGMAPEDQQAFLQTLSGLLKRGVMGYEYRKVNGQPYKVYLENEMGTDLHRAKLYRRKGVSGEW